MEPELADPDLSQHLPAHGSCRHIDGSATDLGGSTITHSSGFASGNPQPPFLSVGHHSGRVTALWVSLGDLAVKEGRAGRKAKHNQHLKVGICGEHGGDPESVVFCHKVGMDYVSCSPFRVPIARLAAAQAALGETARDK